MKFYYVTTDPLNAATAEALADKHGLDLEVAEPRDLPRLEREEARLVLDWDFLPEDHRTRLLNGTRAQVAAVHGHSLGEALSSFLPRRGVLCGTRLDARFLLALRGDASAA